MKKYKISIITVTKNSEKFLSENILSVKSQNYKNFEHIIVDGNSKDKTIKSQNKKNKTEISQIVAENLAKKAIDKKITKIYFDRGLYKYHGRVKVFADVLRKNGMEF